MAVDDAFRRERRVIEEFVAQSGAEYPFDGQERDEKRYQASRKDLQKYLGESVRSQIDNVEKRQEAEMRERRNSDKPTLPRPAQIADRDRTPAVADCVEPIFQCLSKGFEHGITGPRTNLKQKCKPRVDPVTLLRSVPGLHARSHFLRGSINSSESCVILLRFSSGVNRREWRVRRPASFFLTGFTG